MEDRRKNLRFAKNAARKYCFVPECKNTGLNNPTKLFITVPRGERRKIWISHVRRDPARTSLQSTLYCCEDHFDLPEDLENYMRVKLDAAAKIHLKKEVLPRFFLTKSLKEQNEFSDQLIKKENLYDEEEEKIDISETFIKEEAIDLSESFIKEENVDLSGSFIKEENLNGWPEEDMMMPEYDCVKSFDYEEGDNEEIEEEVETKPFATVDVLPYEEEEEEEEEEKRRNEISYCTGKSKQGEENISMNTLFASNDAENSEGSQEICKQNTPYMWKTEYPCHLCEKKYLLLSNLKEHLRSHTRVKPYQCDKCSKSFMRQYALTRHKNIHTGGSYF